METEKIVTVTLTHTLRLPDTIQAEALRFVAASRKTTNDTIEILWEQLNQFKDTKGPAWKQVGKLIEQPHNNGNRQWRCESETAGRILRQQADRKAVFEQIFPILSESLIVPATEKTRTRKNRKEIFAQLGILKEKLVGDAEKIAYMLNVTEQACNFFFENDKFPETYEEMQEIPLLKTGMLTFAADDGGKQGQAYRYSIENGKLSLKLRTPDENGKWRWLEPVEIKLPKNTAEFVKDSTRFAAPTLRAVAQADGTLVACLDIIIERIPLDKPSWNHSENILSFDWGVRKLITAVVISPDGEQLSRPFYLKTGGFDGKQARLRKQISELQAKRDKLKKKTKKRIALQTEIDKCWKAYSNRNRSSAHFCSNLLLLLSKMFGCHAIACEWLATLKTIGHGRDTKSRWRNWRNNTTIRSALTNVLKYKCKLAGIILRFEQPRHTSHTCPRCGKHADTFKSPSHTEPIDWGAWMKCLECGWNGSRDYAAAINIGRLTAAYFKNKKENPEKKSYAGFRVDSPKVKPASYIGAGVALPFVPTECKRIYVRVNSGIKYKTFFAGWPRSITMSPMLPSHSPPYVHI